VVWKTLTKRAVAEAWQELGGIPEREDAIVLTSAGFAVVDGQTTAPCLDILHTWTGASVGKGALVAMHSARTAPLWFFLYDQGTGMGAYIEVNGDQLKELFSLRPRQIRREMAWMPSGDLFTHIGVAQINYDYLMSDDLLYGALVNDKVFGGNEFSIVGVVSAIEHEVPHDLLEAVKFHDHFCPGVSSGYFIVD
jgi:formylmethanofuran dehydrogenase subunit E-like metal-binding protein